MALDRFVNFGADSAPRRRDDIEALLVDYFDAAATSVSWERDRFFVHLVGKTSPALARQHDVPDWYRYVEPERATRWIEVWLGEDCIDVMTRNQDELTNDLAAGLARLIARFWRGKLEEG